MTIGNIGNCPYAIFGVGAKKGLDMNNQIELCLEIAVAAHKGQLDKVGLPVILHPLHVGEMGSCEDEICVGFLHDVIEDTSLNGEEARIPFPRHTMEDLKRFSSRSLRQSLKINLKKPA